MKTVPGAFDESPKHRCSCPAGSHPQHRNYLEAAAERDGQICELGWRKREPKPDIADDQMWTPTAVAAPSPFTTRDEREFARIEALRDQELARAMLLDIHAVRNDPTSPINLNPMRNMLARFCRAVLRAYNQPDPTKE